MIDGVFYFMGFLQTCACILMADPGREERSARAEMDLSRDRQDDGRPR